MDERRMLALVELIGRTGAGAFGIRYSDPEPPTVWLAVAEYPDGRWEADAGHDPLQAAGRLAERLIDGGQCKHCGRPSSLALEHDDQLADATSAHLCWYVYDPELNTFRRSCEGT